MTRPQMRAVRMGRRAAGSDAESQHPGPGCRRQGRWWGLRVLATKTRGREEHTCAWGKGEERESGSL